jgi:hypothetical protein
MAPLTVSALRNYGNWRAVDRDMEAEVPARVVVRRSRSIVGLAMTFEIRIDDAVAGRVKSGQSLSYELGQGQHSVQAFVANPMGDPGVDRTRSSWPLEVDLSDGDTVLVAVGPGVAAAPVVELGQATIVERPYVTEHNIIMLTLQGYYGADQQVPAPEPRFTGTTIVRLMLAVAIIAALAITLISQPGSALRNSSQITAGGASVALILLFVRGDRTPR